MYFNDVHILVYVAFGLVGLLMGRLVSFCNYRLPEYKKIISKDFFKKDVKYKHNFIISIITAIIYIAILYFLGIGKGFIENLNLIKAVILTPMLLSALMIDYKLQIIPNRLNLTMFEIGILLTCLAGVHNINIAVNMILGMLTGGGIFILITLIGGLIAGKEAMGFGDVKLMAALGLYFGFANIICVTLLSFLIGAILSIIILIIKRKNASEYIAFGPFIVIASFIMIIVPFNTILKLLLMIFSLGLIRI